MRTLTSTDPLARELRQNSPFLGLLPDAERRKPRFVWTEDMRPPMGSMTPGTIADSPADGEPMELAWDLKSAATTLDMGAAVAAKL